MTGNVNHSCSMFRLPFNEVFRISPRLTNSFCNLVNSDSKINRLLSHVYRKTWTKSQLIDYIKDNVVLETEKYIVTSVPQGIALKKTSQWLDTVTPLSCEADLNEILKELPAVFSTGYLYLALYPKCNSSGLMIIGKSFNDSRYIKKNLDLAASLNRYTLSFLAVVLGCPEQNFTQTFGVTAKKAGEKYCTEILSHFKKSEDIRTVGYKHRVLASTPLASLVEIKITKDVRDCVRHILGTKCLTPILGDTWNYLKSKSSFMGSPLMMNPEVVNVKTVSLNPDLLAKLDLQPGDEDIIPIHAHLHSLNLTFKKQKEFFVSVPPPESFVWTCHQLGFEEIKNYEKLK